MKINALLHWTIELNEKNKKMNLILLFPFALQIFVYYLKVLEIVRAADAFTSVPPKSPSEHHDQDKIQKTTTVVISKHTLDTNPAIQPAATSVTGGNTPSPTSPSTTAPVPVSVAGSVSPTHISTATTTATPSPVSQPQSPQVC